MWKCRKCSTDNPKQSSYCQTCGEKQEEIKGFTAPTRVEKDLTDMTVEQMYTKAEQRLFNGDYSLLMLYGKVAFGLGVVSIIIFILWIILNLGYFDFTVFVLRLVGTAATSVSCFIIANLIELVISLKSEVNYSAQSNYVNTRINKELLDTVKDIQAQLKK
ncbi:MAG: zinc ribbon domain-containing protein [Turicibacter sp.]|nr:zinc ribbon domain-containing protein [Turicibacter sp.]